MSLSAPSDERGRKTAATSRTDHFLPRQYQPRDPSPYLFTDRVTGYRSPHAGADKHGGGGASSAVSSVLQSYSTSFSAVTCVSASAGRRGTSPVTQRRAQLAMATLPRRGPRSSLPDTQDVPSSQRTASCDILASSGPHAERTCGVARQDSLSAKAASCDMLDSPRLCLPSHDADPHNAFEQRRLGPKYSSTPTRGQRHVQSASSTLTDQHIRSDAGVDSSNTMESVFLPDSPRSPFTKSLELLDASGGYAAVSKSAGDSVHPADDVDKTKLCQHVLTIDYTTNVVLTYSQLKKLKKKGALPEPGAETERLVQRMLADVTARSPPPHTPDPRPARSRLRSAVDKKASTLINILRRFRSPRTEKEPESKRGRRSKSAGRLEGNRIVESDSNIGFSGGEISYEGPSTTSSDQSTSALHSSTPSEPMRSSDADSPLNSPHTVSSNSQSSSSQPPLPTLLSAKPNDDTAKQTVNSTSAPRYLKALGDNRSGDNAVYRSFKEKQSPGYRRRAEAGFMRAHALRVVDIPLQVAGKPQGQ